MNDLHVSNFNSPLCVGVGSMYRVARPNNVPICQSISQGWKSLFFFCHAESFDAWKLQLFSYHSTSSLLLLKFWLILGFPITYFLSWRILWSQCSLLGYFLDDNRIISKENTIQDDREKCSDCSDYDFVKKKELQAECNVLVVFFFNIAKHYRTTEFLSVGIFHPPWKTNISAMRLQ